MDRIAQFEDSASRSRGTHEGESSRPLCDRLSRTRDSSQRQLPTDHDHAVSTREYETDQSSRKLPRLPLALSSINKHYPHKRTGIDRVTPYQWPVAMKALLPRELNVPLLSIGLPVPPRQCRPMSVTNSLRLATSHCSEMVHIRDVPRLDVQLPDDRESLVAMVAFTARRAEGQAQRVEELKRRADDLHLELLRAQLELERLRKWHYGRRTDRLKSAGDLAQLPLSFAEQLDRNAIHPEDLPPHSEPEDRNPSTFKAVESLGFGSLPKSPIKTPWLSIGLRHFAHLIRREAARSLKAELQARGSAHVIHKRRTETDHTGSTA